jgi:hypothetical protein
MGGNEQSEDTFSGVHLMTDLLLDCKSSQFKSPPSLFHAKPLKLSNLIITTSAALKIAHFWGATAADHASWLQLNHLHLRLLEFLFYFHCFLILKINKK